MGTARPSKLERKFLDDALDHIERHMAERGFNVTSLCILLGMSRTTVYRKFRALTGKTPTEVIRLVKLEHSAGLISKGETNLREAARLSGFYNQSYFSKCFRQHFGMSPSEASRQSEVLNNDSSD